MKKWISASIIMLLASCFWTGCWSVSNFETGRSLEKGDGELGFNVGALTLAAEGSSVPIPAFDIGGKYGLTDRIDLGLKYSNFTVITVDYKYQMFGDLQSPYAVAAGLSFGGSVVRIPWDNSRTRFFQYDLPLHVSFHPASWFAVGVSPRYTGIGLTSTTSGFEVLHFLGATPGIEVGHKMRGVLSYSYLSPLNVGSISTALHQVAVGMKFDF